MKRWYSMAFAAFAMLMLASVPVLAQETKKVDPIEELKTGVGDTKVLADSAWLMTSTALVMLMTPGLALFYGGMVRRKNILATMMHSMVSLAIVGVFWIAIGYSLAFGDPWLKIGDKGILGFSPGLIFLRDVTPTTLVPNLNIPVYLHMLYQGMFAIITPALISGALAERIRFKTYLVFVLAWMVLVYCPLAHMVWAMDWNWANTLLAESARNAELFEKSGKAMAGYLGGMDALDFAGGTVVHIAAGFSALAAILVLRKRFGYGEQVFHPNSMVLCLSGAGILWFGWFGFNGGSGLGSGTLAVSAFAATQAAAASAALTWLLVEWLHRGKPTALGLASGLVAGLVAVTPASGYVLPWHGLVLGVAAGVVCYLAVALKASLTYDDSLDAFGVHGVGGFLGAVLTGIFCLKSVNSVAVVNEGLLYNTEKPLLQLYLQLFAAVVAAVLAFVVSFVVIKVLDVVMGFTVDAQEETDGLDRTEHGEIGFDYGGVDTAAVIGSTAMEPRAASIPPSDRKRYHIVVDGVHNGDLIKVWSDMCQPGSSTPVEFKAVYPYVTTVQGNRFQLRGGDKEVMRNNLERLFHGRLPGNVRVRVDS